MIIFRHYAILILISILLPLEYALSQPNIEADSLVPINHKTKAYNAIKDLKEGILIVRLETNSRKIKELEKLLSDPGINAGNKKRLEYMLDETREQTASMNGILVEAFKTYYMFTEIRFMYDTAAHQLANGVEKGIFLNDGLQPDPSISLDGKSYLVVYHGKPFNSQIQQSNFLVVLDSDFHQLQTPFPNSFNVATAFYHAVFLKENSENYFKRVVKKLNKDHELFYKRSDAKGLLPD